MKHVELDPNNEHARLQRMLEYRGRTEFWTGFFTAMGINASIWILYFILK